MRESYPSVWHTKLMIRRLLEECGVAVYCDLHAHSRKHNIFVYGCESKRTGSQARLSEQVFPLMLHKNAADKVNSPSQLIRKPFTRESSSKMSTRQLTVTGIANVCPVLVRELQIPLRERERGDGPRSRLVHGGAEQLHDGGVHGRVGHRLQIRQPLLHAGLRANRPSVLRDSTRLLRPGPGQGMSEHVLTSLETRSIVLINDCVA